MEIENLSPFSVASVPAITREGVDVQVVCVAARHELMAAPARGTPPSAEQGEPILEDVYWGEPGVSSLRMEGQGIYERPGTDIVISGHACAPSEVPVSRLLLTVRVAELEQRALVSGDRVWRRDVVGLVPSTPQPFSKLPLRYELAFGGRVDERSVIADNPIGCGWYADARAASGRPLPNIEDPDQPIVGIGDRPQPVGFCAIPRHWPARLRHAGTYDEAWMKTRMPFWPKDLDLRFFQAASPGLVLDRHLLGGEPISLTGFSATGPISFPVPRNRLLLKSYFDGYEELLEMTADTLHIEPDEGRFTLYYRVAIARGAGPDEYLASVLRQMHEWENVGLE
jgi:hypothetical protein